MSKANLRFGIIGLTVATSLIHLSLGVGLSDSLDILFLLNGLGYLALMWTFFWTPGFIKVSKKLVYNTYLIFPIVTVVAYFVMWGADSFSNPFGLVTKGIEVLLVVALWKHKS